MVWKVNISISTMQAMFHQVVMISSLHVDTWSAQFYYPLPIKERLVIQPP
jgi:hypothetical protein